MESETTEFGYGNFVKQATGSIGEDYRVISYPYDRYEVKVRVGPRNEFIGIVEVKLNKDFLSHKQRMGIQNYVDTDEFYRE